MKPATKTPDTISQNIESIAAFYKREHDKVTVPQRVVERLSQFVAQPRFLGGTLFVVVLWILASVCQGLLNQVPFDPPPYFWLQGIVSLLALLTTLVVLIRQERLAKLDERRDHLELQLNLLTEQKTTKLIHLLEELRRDLPMVKDRHDAASEALQQSTDPQRVLAEIDQVGIAPTPAGNPPGGGNTA